MAHPLKGRAAMQSFGRRLRALRVAAKLSQVELGRRALVGDKFIGIIERGLGNPSLVTMALIADALRCELGDMLSRAPSAYAMLPADDVRRAREAAAVIHAVFAKRRNARKNN